MLPAQSFGIKISGSVKILVYPTCPWPELLMLVFGRYMLVVYSLAKAFKMAII